MRFLYLGQCEEGSTSKMRCDYLNAILKPEVTCVIDISVPVRDTNRLFRSLGWRYYIGPLIDNVSRFILRELGCRKFDVVWVDKGVFIKPEILDDLKKTGAFLIHYTPDTAFTFNRSKLFFDGITYYDACITTKSFELSYYGNYCSKNTLYCTQGYDPKIHRPIVAFEEKCCVSFIGKSEISRERILQNLVDEQIDIQVAGYGWDSFVRRNVSNTHLRYLGSKVIGEHYAKVISGSFISLGLLSKVFPEMHTTRTFEIPACGTLLATERNKETESFFNENEVVFFDSDFELIDQIKNLLKDRSQIYKLTNSGMERVYSGGFDYPTILTGVCSNLKLI